MAGIFGVIAPCEIKQTQISLKKIFASLTIEQDESLTGYRIFHNMLYGNSLPISANAATPIISNQNLHIDCLVEGNIFLEQKLKAELREHYDLNNKLREAEYLPYLYAFKRENTPHYLTGWYNIFLLDKGHMSGVLFNSRLGMLPLFICQAEGYFVFASKVETILSLGILDLKFDNITAAEFILFHYPLSEHTFIKGVDTLANGQRIDISAKGREQQVNYWSVERLFGKTMMNRKESSENLRQAFNETVSKLTHNRTDFAVSLTGGWDGRLVLSSLLNKGRQDYKLYSFGAQNSYDIDIPEKIAETLGLDYFVIILDEEYLGQNFTRAALDTVKCSQGIRTYKRAHYLYTMRYLAKNFEYVLSGNCGSNILKFANIVPGTVISQVLFDLFDSDFNLEKIDTNIHNRWDLNMLDFTNYDYDKLRARIKAIKNKLDEFDTSGEKYYYLLLSTVERKYFGNELNSYNDYLYNFSPFVDLNFLEQLSRTFFWGANYKFNSQNIVLRKDISQLYAYLIKHNFEQLIYFETDKGCSIKELTSPIYFPIILYKKLIKQKKQSDAYYTDNTLNYILPYYADSPGAISDKIEQFSRNEYLASYFLWHDMIQNTYHIV